MSRIQKILIANRGEIAMRILRTCREMGIGTVAIYADPDRDAPFVRDADEAVYIGPPMASASFLAIDRIVEIARAQGADAIHPGYGFLAENADFAEACGAAGITFIGPSPASIRSMGHKSRAKELAQAAEVPVVPGFDANQLTDAEIAARAPAVGFPLLLKAASGGGGKGMRIVAHVDELPAALAAARREAQAAFGDATLLVEKYIEQPRHIEVQILGDQHGHLVHCFERECSIQRRYQKIIEEAPSPFVDEDLRARMTAAALRIARQIGYYSAGTVEFVVGPQRDFYFLEVNTRLQVEHPVTEAITGLDLVRLQITVAEGAPLPFQQEDIVRRGHAIECRLCAEDPQKEFLPAIGPVLCFDVPSAAGLRVDSGVETGSEISIYYDSLIAKLIAHADTRRDAARLLARGLALTRIHGLTTNREFLRRLVCDEAFLAGEIDTHFLSRRPELRAVDPRQQEIDAVHAIALALWQQARRRAAAPTLATIPSGWRNNPSQPQCVTYVCGDESIPVSYSLQGRQQATATAAEVTHPVRIIAADDAMIRLELSGLQRRYLVTGDDDRYFVQSPLGSSEFHLQPRFPEAEADSIPGGCQAPMPGKILAVRVEVGAIVERGQCLAVLEAMKMEHDVVAPSDGVITEVRIEPGQQVNSGDVLVVLEAAADAAESNA